MRARCGASPYENDPTRWNRWAKTTRETECSATRTTDDAERNKRVTSEQQAGTSPHGTGPENRVPGNVRSVAIVDLPGEYPLCSRTLCADVPGPYSLSVGRGDGEICAWLGRRRRSPPGLPPLSAVHQVLRPLYRPTTDGVVRRADVCSNGSSTMRPGSLGR